jgi:hypothetical protein
MVTCLDEEQKKNENKPKHKLVVVKESIGLSNSASISTISGSIAQGYEALSSTFDVRQKSIANSFNLEENVQYLKQIAESLEKSVKLTEQQRQQAVEDAKRERRRFYISTAIAIVAIIVTIAVTFL